MHLICIKRTESDERANWHPIVRADLKRIDIFEGKRVFRQVSRGRIAANPKIINLGEAGQLITRISALRISAMDILIRCAGRGQGEENPSSLPTAAPLDI